VATAAGAYEELQWHPERKTSVGRILADLRRPVDSADRTFVELAAASYSPVAYAPQVVGITVGRALGATALGCMYLARVAALVAVAAAVAWALARTPVLRSGLLLVALTPMFLSEAAAVSADGVLNSACLLFVASVLDVALGPGRPTPRRTLAWIGLGVVIALCKPVYLALLLCVFLIPAERVGRGRQALLFAALVVPSLLALRAWSLLTYAHGHVPTSTESQGHLGALLSSPLSFAWRVAWSYIFFLPRLVQGFIGNLGWLDTPLPPPVVFLYVVALLAVAAAEGGPTVMDPPRRVLLAVMVALVAAAIAAAMYLYSPIERSPHFPSNSLNPSVIEGMQGRYFIPLAPVVLLLLSSCLSRWRPVWRARVDQARLRRVAGAFSAACLAIAVVTVGLRYYVG
jgi:uncharacterized membrane protein